jgi:hypothetical protein
LQRLEAEGGRHLVIVRYGPKHSIHEEWVYNHADIDNARVVWARESGGRLPELLSHFGDRRIWLAVVERDAVLTPYPGPMMTKLAFGASGQTAAE